LHLLSQPNALLYLGRIRRLNHQLTAYARLLAQELAEVRVNHFLDTAFPDTDSKQPAPPSEIETLRLVLHHLSTGNTTEAAAMIRTRVGAVKRANDFAMQFEQKAKRQRVLDELQTSILGDS
jgi:hypothetical protein